MTDKKNEVLGRAPKIPTTGQHAAGSVVLSPAAIKELSDHYDVKLADLIVCGGEYADRQGGYEFEPASVDGYDIDPNYPFGPRFDIYNVPSAESAQPVTADQHAAGSVEAERAIKDAIRAAYDDGYNHGRADGKGDGGCSRYVGRNVEVERGKKLIAALTSAQPVAAGELPEPIQFMLNLSGDVILALRNTGRDKLADHMTTAVRELIAYGNLRTNDRAAVTKELPKLPDPDHSLDCGAQPFFTADQMRAYGQQCADSRPRPTDDDLWDQTIRDRDTYHEWADKLAEAISKHFDAYIGEHSNTNCPWAEALEAIECADSRPVGGIADLRKALSDCLDYGAMTGADWVAEQAAATLAASTAQPECRYPLCNGTGERDSGGIHPWGAPAMLPCDCAQPAAILEKSRGNK